MKKLLALLLLLNISNINAQITEIVDNISFPFALQIQGDNLFFCVDDGNGPNGEITDTFVYKINLLEENPNIQEVLTTQMVLETVDFLINGNDLYMAEFFGNRISKIDITESSPTPTIVASNIGNIRSLAFKENELFYCDSENQEMISKINITESPSNPIDIIPIGYSPSSIAIKNNELYFSSTPNGRIYKIDINQQNQTPTEVLSGLNNPKTLRFNGDDLYFFNTGYISKIDITDIVPNVIDVFPVSSFLNMIIDENILYISDPNKIYKVDIESLSINEFEFVNQIKLAPNPSSDLIKIIGLNKKLKYKIYDTKSCLISKNEVNSMNIINISALTKGIYFIQFENGITKKFIKE